MSNIPLEFLLSLIVCAIAAAINFAYKHPIALKKLDLVQKILLLEILLIYTYFIWNKATTETIGKISGFIDSKSIILIEKNIDSYLIKDTSIETVLIYMLVLQFFIYFIPEFKNFVEKSDKESE